MYDTYLIKNIVFNYFDASSPRQGPSMIPDLAAAII